jgi:hypothetical protein
LQMIRVVTICSDDTLAELEVFGSFFGRVSREQHDLRVPMVTYLWSRGWRLVKMHRIIIRIY